MKAFSGKAISGVLLAGFAALALPSCGLQKGTMSTNLSTRLPSRVEQGTTVPAISGVSGSTAPTGPINPGTGLRWVESQQTVGVDCTGTTPPAASSGCSQAGSRYVDCNNRVYLSTYNSYWRPSQWPSTDPSCSGPFVGREQYDWEFGDCTTNAGPWAGCSPTNWAYNGGQPEGYSMCADGTEGEIWVDNITSYRARVLTCQ
jgi:hypothetical protein